MLFRSVLLLKRRRRIGRGHHSTLPREAAIGQLAGRAIVKRVVRLLTDGDQIPFAPLPAGEVVHRVDVVDSGCELVASVPAGLAAAEFVAAQDCVAQVRPAFALVVHGKNKSAMTSRRRSWRSCHPAITSAAKQKRQTIYRHHGQIIWRWLSGSGSYSRLRQTRACTVCSTAGSPSALLSVAHVAMLVGRTVGKSTCHPLTPIVYHAHFCFARVLLPLSDKL